MLRTATIILPINAVNDPEEYLRARSATESALVDLFGGFTRTPATGAWRNDEGKVIRDNVNIYTIAAEWTDEQRAELREQARLSLIAYEQEAIYIELPDTGVEFIAVDREGG